MPTLQFKYLDQTAAGFTFNYAARPVDQKILEALAELAREQQLIAKYRALLDGEIMNTGENRMVLHHLVRGQLGKEIVSEGKNLRSLKDDYIGGRYSATSAVGGVMLTLAYGSAAFKAILKGAHEADRAALEEDPRANASLMDALIGAYERNILSYPMVAVLPCSQALLRFPAHLQLLGFRDSQDDFDLVIDGAKSRTKLAANLAAQIVAFALGKSDPNSNKSFAGNRPSSVIYGPMLTPEALGALLAHHENKVMFQGFLWNINSFDQEGVQLGNVLATRILNGEGLDPVIAAHAKMLGVM